MGASNVICRSRSSRDARALYVFSLTDDYDVQHPSEIDTVYETNIKNFDRIEYFATPILTEGRFQ